MPAYEYICEDCRKKTDIEATFSEKEKGLNPVCPSCGSARMSRSFTPLMVKNSLNSVPEKAECGSREACSSCDLRKANT